MSNEIEFLIEKEITLTSEYLVKLKIVNIEFDKLKKIYPNIQFKQNSSVIFCEECKRLAQSENQHHFNTCPCGKTSIDGGGQKMMRIIGDLTKIKLVSSFTIANKKIKKDHREIQEMSLSLKEKLTEINLLRYKIFKLENKV